MTTERCKGCGKEIETRYAKWEDRHDEGTFRRTGLCCDCLHKSDPDSLECKPEGASDDCDVICPWCGYAYQAESSDYGKHEYDENCHHCEREYSVYEEYSITYHTRAKEEKK